MARPWFKAWWAAIPEPFERCTYVHMANFALFALVIFWQPVPIEVWTFSEGWVRDGLWLLFGLGWLILFLAQGRSGCLTCWASTACATGSGGGRTLASA
jgi:hypothetical protein